MEFESHELQAKILLQAIWRSPDYVHQLTSIDRQANQVCNHAVASVAEAVNRALAFSVAGVDAYVALAEYQDPSNRKANNTTGAFAFWMDIDCGEDKAAKGKGYRTVEEAQQAVQKLCQMAGLPLPTHIVYSGGGLHLYWALDASLEKAVWQEYAKKLKAIAEALGFLADPARTADIASVLRIPGTLNYKYDPPRPVYLVYAAESYIETAAMLGAIDAAHAKNCKLSLRQALAGDRYEPEEVPNPKSIAMLAALLECLDPDMAYDDWCHVAMVLHHETHGSNEGLTLFDDWSSHGEKYKGVNETSKKWASFDLDHAHPLRLGTLIYLVQQAGHDAQAILAEAEPQFSVVADDGGEQ